jgi:hypothetical protein
MVQNDEVVTICFMLLTHRLTLSSVVFDLLAVNGSCLGPAMARLQIILQYCHCIYIENLQLWRLRVYDCAAIFADCFIEGEELKKACFLLAIALHSQLVILRTFFAFL